MPSTLTDPDALGFLLQLGDSALPTGAFSHSFGLETQIAAGRVDDGPTLRAWLEAYLATQLTCTEGLAVWWVATGARGVPEVDALLDAATPARQVRLASRRMGAQLRKLAPQLAPGVGVPEAGWPRHYPTVYGWLGRGVGVGAPELVHTFLLGSVISLVQNAVRAVPLGQSAGQRVVTELRGPVAEAAAAVASLTEDDFGLSAPGLEISQMRHEHLRARMFMS